MPDYIVYDPEGYTMVMTSDQAPTPDQIEQAFAEAPPEAITQASPEAQPDVPLESNSEYGTGAEEGAESLLSPLESKARGPALLGASLAAPTVGVGVGQAIRGAGNIGKMIGGSGGATLGARLIPGAPFAGASAGAQGGRWLADTVADPVARAGEKLIETFSKTPVTQFTQQRAYDAAQKAKGATRAKP